MRALLGVAGVFIIALVVWEKEPWLQMPLLGCIAAFAIVGFLIWIVATLLSNHYARIAAAEAAAEKKAQAKARAEASKKKSNSKLQFVEVDIETGELVD